ncbi:hypothetical protein KEM48_002753 [Puccinia striiformis f. sp. tritici PST-130]|nr:hypothetical protein KEM48_002753 [Puccinia striiformis f. sp. tritici PST-130]
MAPSQNPQNTPSDDPELKGRKVVWKPVLSTPFTYQCLSESQHHIRLEQLEGDQTFEIQCSLETSLHKTGRLAHIVELRSGKKIEFRTTYLRDALNRTPKISRDTRKIQVILAAVVALRGEDVRMSALSPMAREHVKPISSPSCITSAHKSEGHPSIANKGGVLLLPTHVKHYKTSLPTDMRKHNLERTESRKQHKIAKLERN